MKRQYPLAVAAAGLLLNSEIPLSYAQELMLEEVIVTAQRREQTLQDVPISVSVIDAETIQKTNITDAQDYLAITPNVGFAEEGQRGSRSIRISIRGVDSLTGNEGTGQVSPIGYYMDEFSIGQVAQGTANPLLMDIERIEVLRGPQGTFFGLNALGGALNITTKKPDENGYAEISGEVGNYDMWNISGIFNAPVSDDFFVRGVFSTGDSHALVENKNPVGGDSANQSVNYRLAGRWLASDKLTVDASTTYSKDEQDLQELVSTCVLNRSGQSSIPRASAEQLGFQTFNRPFGVEDGVGCFPHNDDSVNVSVPVLGANAAGVTGAQRDKEQFNAESLTSVLTLTYEADNFTLKSITGLIETEADQLFDLDAISAESVVRQNEQETDAWSQELRLSGSTDGGLDWVVGAVYFESENDRYSLILTDALGFRGTQFAPFSVINADFQTTDTEAYAFYADVTWNVTDALSVSVGARASEDEVEQCGVDFSGGGTGPLECETADTSDFSPKFSANMKWNDDLSTYITISRGYKPAGVDVFQTDPNSFFDEETVWNYEIGLKGSLWGGRARVNAALFFMEWEDMQAQSNVLDCLPIGDPNCQFISRRTTTNVEDGADIEGIELDFIGLLSENWTISGSVGYMEAEFNDFGTPEEIAMGQGPFVQGRGPLSLSGQTIPKAPELTYNLNLEYGFEWMGGDGYVRLEYIYRDEQVANFDSYIYLLDPAVARVPDVSGPGGFPYLISDYDVLNLRAGWRRNNWKLSASVENLSGEDYYTGTRAGFSFTGIRVRPHPTTFSLKATYSWGG